MIIIDGTTVTATSKEGTKKTMPIDRWMDKIAPENIPRVHPDGVKCIVKRGSHMVMVHQSPPALRNLKWIAKDSPKMFGPGTVYRDVILALPYVITFAVFQPYTVAGSKNIISLSGWNECFFSTRSISGLQDEVCFPGLLNCSKWPDNSGRAECAWICTEKLNYGALLQEGNEDQRVLKGLSALLNCLFESGFNYSSERHEGNSWYSATKDLDNRITTVEAWEEASQKNPLFALDVPWIKSPKTVGDIVDRVLNIAGCSATKQATLPDMERAVFNSR